jgi:3-deoxy-manno-octulosonate cytidylyltransferase (CMP-KDO synthetase)
MLQHVWERASEARYLTSVVIATDDERIRSAAQKFGARVVMTRDDHPSGTDRVAEVASSSDAHWVVNVQGDEPTLDPSAIDQTILGVLDQDEATAAPMGTLKTRIHDLAVVQDPNVVKVVTDHANNAIYFSRSPIPHVRQAGDETAYFKHIGLYIYQREFLLAYPDLPVGPLERAERLEQLRALENGFRIRVVETEYDSLGVDTPEDHRHVTELFEKTLLTKGTAD